MEDSQDAREEVLLPAYRVTGKPEVNFSIADHTTTIDGESSLRYLDFPLALQVPKQTEVGDER